MNQHSGPATSGARVARRLDLTITGQDSSGRNFAEPAHTELVTRDGGVIVCFVPLEPGALISVQHGNRRADARILGVIRIHDEEHSYGISLEGSFGPVFWQVEFAPGASPSATMLQCSRCASQASLVLGEMQKIVFESARVVAHHCPKCADHTLWQAPVVLDDVELVTGADAYQQTGALVNRQRTANDRRHKRLQVRNAKACLKRVGFKDDVVDVLDLSRGGIRFLSLVDYQPDSRVEVAAPYTEGGANVFISARVVRVKSRATVDIPGEFALEYMKLG